MGNRGGRIHDASQRLTRRRWASRRWIICLCEFRGRQRNVWGDSYTEIFFLDEVTALAGGHRPCFECRRAEARDYASCCGIDGGADAIDTLLHHERVDGRTQRQHELALESLPDGAMIARDGQAFAIRGSALLPWSFHGYGAPAPRPDGLARVLTPPASLTALQRGYGPVWHSSAVTR